MTRLLTSILLVTTFLTAHGQPTEVTADYYAQIKDFDLTTIFSADSFATEEPGADRPKVDRPEPYGYIDTNYTRFYIHFLSSAQNKENPYQYNIIGKTRVKNNICDFHGTITFIKAKLYTELEFPKTKIGYAIGEVLFYEDTNQAGSGVIKGKLTCNFYLDKKGQLKYNSLMWGSDGFSNNEVIGSWTSYKTKKSKKCNWGDFRIPDSGDFDMGAGEFSPAEKYLKNGWQSYRDSFGKQYKPTDNWWTPKTTKYAGIYSFGDNVEKGPVGAVTIYPETDSTVLFYIDVCRGAPSYNLGQSYDRLKIKNGEGVYFTDKYANSKKGCQWQVSVDKDVLVIKTLDDCYECGFGHAVYADNQYNRKDSLVHDYFTDGHGRKIYFSKTTPENYLK